MGSADQRIEPLFRRRAPSPDLAGLVTGIFGYQEHGEALKGLVETASLTVPLIINFGTPYRIGLGRAPHQGDRYSSFAAGLFAGPVIMSSDGSAQCIQVNFTPLGGRLFFALPMRELADRMVALDDLGDGEINVLAARLEEINSWETRLDMVERFVKCRLRQGIAADPAIAWAFDALTRTGGRVRIGKIAKTLDWSRRKLVERFREDIGLPPKAVARIIRVNAAQEMASGSAAPDWADIAAACGYADQPHLVREFSELAGASPVRWREAA